jgi:hypothetical protein
MNLDATPQTVRAVAEVFKLAAFLDDRIAAPDPGRIAAWAEQVQRHNLAESDLLNGVQGFYDGPSSHAIGVGDLIQHARQCRRERREVEHDAAIEAQEAAGDAKAVEAIASVTVTGPTKHRTPRLEAAEIALQGAVDKESAMAAIREYFAAKAEARKAPVEEKSA